MSFETEMVDPSGTHLQGHIKASYEELTSLFGQPMPGFDKTDQEWAIRFRDGTVATIYDWKVGINYCGESGLHATQITHWNVGGKSPIAVIQVENALSRHRLNALKDALRALKDASRAA